MHVVEVRVEPGHEVPQSALLTLMEALERLGADEVDADETPGRSAVYGYFLSRAPGPERLAGLGGQPGLLAPRLITLPALRTLEVPELVRRPFVWGPFELRTSSATSAPSAPHPLVLDTHGAWGTGMHPTTAMMLDRLAAAPVTGAALDVGTGTGVLAIAALRLGADRATVTDIEPPALEAARSNAAANQLQDRLTLAGDVPPADLEGGYDLVLANIRVPPLLGLAEGLVARLAPGGRLLLSGIRAHEYPAVRAAFDRAGARFVDQTHARGWLCMAFEGPATR